MELGLHVSDFTWPGGAPALAPTLVRIARDAEDAGFARLSVMDQFLEIGHIGPSATAPARLAKALPTLDVLSGGRAMLGVGAAWNADESAGLGIPFPPTTERFDRLEETLQIILQMWGDDDGPYQGKYYQLGRTLNSPQPLSSPRPRILIGGSGEKKKLTLGSPEPRARHPFRRPQLA